MDSQVLVIGGVAVLFILIAAIVLLTGGEEAAVQERLGRYGRQPEEEKKEKKKKDKKESKGVLTDSLDRAIEGRGFADKLAVKIARANAKLTVAEFLALQVIAVIIGFGVAFVAFGLVVGIVAGLAGFIGPRIWLNIRKNGRLKAFNEQLGDAINQMVNGLRAGYSVQQAMESVASELPPPISQEFGRAVQEMQFGLSMDQALANMLRRIDSPDLDLMITAISVQREVGGNLAEILEVISHTIRERIRIQGEIRVLTSQGRITGYVIGGLPFAIALLLMMINRPYIMRMFNSTCGWIMVAVILILIAIGSFVISKITNIEV